jgi:hypothetical protein
MINTIPCYLCDGIPINQRIDDHRSEIRCFNYECKNDIVVNYIDDEDDAIKEWNRLNS